MINKKITTLKSCLAQYQSLFTPAESRTVKSRICKIILPGLGYQIPPVKKGQSLWNSDAIQAFLDEIRLEHLTATQLQLILIEQLEQQQIPSKSQRSYRHYVNHFIQWLLKQGLLTEDPQSLKTNKGQSVSQLKWSKGFNTRSPEGKVTNKGLCQQYGLSLNLDDYLTAQTTIEEKNAISTNLDRIRQEVQSFETFLQHQGLASTTIELNRKQTYRFLGYLHRFRGISLADLSLTSIIPYVEVKKLEEVYHFSGLSDSDKLQVYESVAAVEFRHKSFAKETLTLVQNLAQINQLRAITVASYGDALINLAKYIYRYNTDKIIYPNYEDIPCLQYLKTIFQPYKRQGKQQKKLIPFSQRGIHSYSSVLEVLEHLKKEADLSFTTISYNSKRLGRVITDKRPRRTTAQAVDYLKLIMMGMICLNIPERQAIFRNLKIGETFHHGAFIDNQLVPYHQLKAKDKPLAKFYLLIPQELRKSSKHGEIYYQEVNNYQFSDGETFYQCLEKWLYSGYLNSEGKKQGWRSRLATDASENYLIFSPKKRQPLNAANYSKIFQRTFVRLKGAPFNPHSLRTLLHTEAKRMGMTSAESESLSILMGNDEDTRNLYYDARSYNEVTAPAVNLFNKILNHCR